MNRWISTGIVVLGIMHAGVSSGLEPWRYSVDVAVDVGTSPARISLSWPTDSNARQYTIRRKPAGAESWSTVANLPGNSSGYTDYAVGVGSAFEYEIQEDTSHYPFPDGDPSRWVSAFSYVYAGVNAPLKDSKGKVVLLIDSSISGSISAELATFKQDLVGAGWQVIERVVNRDASPNYVRNVVRNEYNADPSRVRSVVLIGHIPVPYSGAINPDLHENHIGAWPADVFYAEMDGAWSDNFVTTFQSEYPENHNVPGDGKFDQSQIPSRVELEVGRIDFWGMPAFNASEVDLLRQYFRKNHAFRHRAFTLPRRGLIRDNFGDLEGDAPAVDAWRHYTAFFGPGSAREIGTGDFFPVLNNEGFLWAYGCGGGGDDKADGVGTTYDFARSDPRAAFLILHGSWFGDWNRYDNFLRAAIGSPNYTLASVWSGLPHWFMHHMALGETIGYSTRVSQNNRDLYKSHVNLERAEVHISLIGDPTLEMFPVAPPQNVNAQLGNNVTLIWDPAPDESIVGYHVYVSQNPAGPFQRLTESPIASRSFVHAPSAGAYTYMIRAVKLERTGSGTFYNASQGITRTVSLNGRVNTRPTISGVPDQTIPANGSTQSLSFTIGDAESSADSLNVRASSSDEQVIPNSNLQLSGSGSNRTIKVAAAEQAGTANITLIVSDGELTATQNFYVTVTKANEPPSAHPQSLSTPVGTPLLIKLTATDPEGSALNFSIVEGPVKGTLSGAAPAVTYTPNPDARGFDSFTFKVSDGVAESSSATISVEIVPTVRVQSIEANARGGARLRAELRADRKFYVEASSDAIHWQIIGSGQSDANGYAEFIDSEKGDTIRFYRIEVE